MGSSESSTAESLCVDGLTTGGYRREQSRRRSGPPPPQSTTDRYSTLGLTTGGYWLVCRLDYRRQSPVAATTAAQVANASAERPDSQDFRTRTAYGVGPSNGMILRASLRFLFDESQSPAT